MCLDESNGYYDSSPELRSDLNFSKVVNATDQLIWCVLDVAVAAVEYHAVQNAGYDSNLAELSAPYVSTAVVRHVAVGEKIAAEA